MPAAYLNMNMEFEKVSTTFLKVIGMENPAELWFTDLILPSDISKVINIHRQLIREKQESDPHYLPPILSQRAQVIHDLQFWSETVTSFPLRYSETLTMVRQNGTLVRCHLRLDLIQISSMYFVLLLLLVT